MAIVYQYGRAYRTIFMDGSRHPGASSFWNGDSRGRWEGGTLVVDVKNFNGQSWLDAAGNYHSDALHVVERYTRTGPETIRYEATIEDPKVFTRAWKIRVPLELNTGQNRRLLEHECDLAGQGIDVSQIPSSVGMRGLSKPGPVMRMPDSKPDLEGFWIAQAAGARDGVEEHSGDSGSVGGPSIVIDPPNGKIPYQGWAHAKQQDLKLHHRNDQPDAHCLQSGVPHQMWTGSGFHILQPRGYVVMLWNFMQASRIIAMDGRQHIAAEIKLTQGDSIGQWDGDTLVIDTTNLNDKTWFDSIGDFHSDKEHVVERFTPVDSDTIDYRATIEDPRVYYRKWTVGFPIWRDPSPRKEQVESVCPEGSGK